MRVRVNIDISQTLCRGCLVNVGDSQAQSFKYECMPIFCYWCGVMNHDENDCRMWASSQGTLKKEDYQYGAWLWATIEWFQVSHVMRNKLIHLLWQRHNKSSGRWLASQKSSLEKVWRGRGVVDTGKFNEPKFMVILFVSCQTLQKKSLLIHRCLVHIREY